jgi:hypothetical protein|mmetsp:Transcript_12888/g.30381  ORF Transcript_12888/g.30381 Transcript_12888/m.30381 type:complete len:105 (-) Transcript_12888:1136-1450(-)
MKEFIMKKLLIILIGSFTLSAAAPALAGPDWQIIEKARKDKQAAVQPAQHASSLPPSGAQGECRVDPLVLQLDHGPRADTSPYINQLRRERHEAQLKACASKTK